jgi:hypothetical protein
MYPFSAAYGISDRSPYMNLPKPRRIASKVYSGYILSRIPIGTRHRVSWKGPRYPHIPPEVEWCRSAMCGLDPKAWAVTPKLFRNMGAFARIVRGGMYEQTGTVGGAACGVLRVRDNHAESGQSCEPTPQVKKRLFRVGINFLIQYLFFGPVCAPSTFLSFPRDSAHLEQYCV